ncbi:MAG TPA: hypothetical protein DIU15_06875 [Deltaproteobacteria bacterium]|nr:hypothetical protein [Deltaproteobacteria bacterium]HCP45746.1 hypothetical protein [Deltaproteobacteria bacterium]
MPPNTLRQLQDAFRKAAGKLSPGPSNPASAQTVRAWLVLSPILAERRWLEAAESAIANLRPAAIPNEDVADWVLNCCRAWVLHASGPSRRVAEELMRRLPVNTRTIPARLAYWRISGDHADYEQALSVIPDTSSASLSSLIEPMEAAAALWSAHQATARPDFADAARALLSTTEPGQIPLSFWPLAADVQDWGPPSVAPDVDQWEQTPPPPALVIPAAAALALPTLELWIDWWVERELREGIVAEAATYPYAGLRLRFRRLSQRDQVRFTPVLDGDARETLLDAAIIGAHLDQVLEEVDLSPLKRAPRRGMSRTGKR